MVWREKNGYAVSPRETLRFVSHVNYFEQVCEQDKGIHGPRLWVIIYYTILYMYIICIYLKKLNCGCGHTPVISAALNPNEEQFSLPSALIQVDIWSKKLFVTCASTLTSLLCREIKRCTECFYRFIPEGINGAKSTAETHDVCFEQEVCRRVSCCWVGGSGGGTPGRQEKKKRIELNSVF